MIAEQAPGTTQRTREKASLNNIDRYYSEILQKGRLNAPSITEAARDLAARWYRTF